LFAKKEETKMRGKSILKRSVLGVAVLMVFAMVLVSCTQSGGNTGAGDSATPATGGEATETSTDDGTGGEKAYTLGFSNWGKGVYPLDVLELETQNFTDLNGLKLLPASNDFKADKIVSDVQSLISSQVDGIAIMCAVETTIPTVANLMNEAGTPFVFFDKLPSDLAVLDKIVAEDPAFVRACAPTN
jgi:ABC-type sugar transport system substrate-binding protein